MNVNRSAPFVSLVDTSGQDVAVKNADQTSGNGEQRIDGGFRPRFPFDFPTEWYCRPVGFGGRLVAVFELLPQVGGQVGPQGNRRTSPILLGGSIEDGIRQRPFETQLRRG